LFKTQTFFILHCGGDIRQFIPFVIEVNFACIQPLEARAGNDAKKLKNEYGKDIAFFENINMDILARERKVKIEEEVGSKVLGVKEGGGYIFHSDHSAPPTESWWLLKTCTGIQNSIASEAMPDGKKN
jgi:hypothetical protein